MMDSLTIVSMNIVDLHLIHLVVLIFEENLLDYIQYRLYIYQTLIRDVQLLCPNDEGH